MEITVEIEYIDIDLTLNDDSIFDFDCFDNNDY
jgi:hypothetical protein